MLDIYTIIETVCETLEVSKDAVCSRSRKREVVDARFLCCYFIKVYHPDLNLKIIALYVGGDNHCFARYAINQTSELYKINMLFKRKFDACKDALNVCLEINSIPQY